MSSEFDVMKRHYLQRDLAARRWKAEGGRVVGYFCDSVPVEIISAAGFFPIRISGDPRGDTDVAKKHIIPRFTIREDFVHSMLNRILTGAYDFLDYLIIPHARDSIHRLYQLLAMMKTSEPSLNLPELFFLDTLHTTFFSSAVYERDRMIELKETLENWSEQEITKELLSNAIAISNENKKLLKKMASLRTAEPPRISGAEALQIIGSAMFMPLDTHNDLLRKFLEEADAHPERNGVRLFVSGSPLDNLQLYEIIESSDATVVAEDHCWGNRYFEVLIDTSLDPLESIIQRYHLRSPCARMFPTKRRREYCLNHASEAKAQGVIFHVFEHDVTESWEVPDKIKALEEKGIGTLDLRKQPYLIKEPEQLKTRIDEFVDSI